MAVRSKAYLETDSHPSSRLPVELAAAGLLRAPAPAPTPAHKARQHPRGVYGPASGAGAGEGPRSGSADAPVAESAAGAIVACHDLPALLTRVSELGAHPGVRLEELGHVHKYPISALHLGVRSPQSAREALGSEDTQRSSARPLLRVLVTAGVHGVEPAGPAAALLFARQMLADPARHPGVAVTVVPLVNPVGYVTRQRGNAEHFDLNRCFTDQPTAPYEVAVVRALVSRGQFDLGVDLHSSRSAGERGFFALHKDAGDVLAVAMQRFQRRYPVLCESTDRYVLEGPGVLRSGNHGTIKDYLGAHGARWAITIEAPAVWPYEAQVCGSAEIIHTIIEAGRGVRC